LRAAHFRVVALLDMASRPTVGTVTIDRAAGLFTVRPLRRRRLYTLPLDMVASLVVRKIIAEEARQAREEKRARKRR